MRVLPGDPHAAGNGRMRADDAVVPDLDLVVEFHVILDHGVLDGAAIDRGVGADLAVGADDHAPDLRDLEPAPAFLRHAESVRSDHRAGMNDRARANHAARVKRDVGMKHDVLAQDHAFPNCTSGPDIHARRDLRAIADHRMGSDGSARIDLRRRGDDGRRMHAGSSARGRIEKGRRGRVGRIRVGMNQFGKARGACLRRCHDHRAGARGCEQSAITHADQERQRAGTGVLERSHVIHAHVAVSVERRADARREVGQTYTGRRGIRRHRGRG